LRQPSTGSAGAAEYAAVYTLGAGGARMQAG